MFCIFSCWLDRDDGSSIAISCSFMFACVVCHARVERTDGVLADCGNILLLAQVCLNQSGFLWKCMCCVCAAYVFGLMCCWLWFCSDLSLFIYWGHGDSVCVSF